MCHLLPQKKSTTYVAVVLCFVDQNLKIITIGCQGRKRLQARADIYLPERKEVFVRHLSFLENTSLPPATCIIF